MANCRVTLSLICALLGAPYTNGAEHHVVEELEITTLSTMLTELRGVGEWGFAALVEADGRRLLFDTGARPGTVLQNAEELGIDLSDVETVVVSHNHFDHTGGLVTLRRELQKRNPAALAVTHVGRGIFLERRTDPDALRSLSIPRGLLVDVRDVRDSYEALGGRFHVHAEPHELSPGVWVTGPISRVHPEKNWTPFTKIVHGEDVVEDTIPEDQALVINTARGLVVLAGCGHAGLVNTMESARSIVADRSVRAVLGGFHLLNATDEQIAWTGSKLREFGVEHVLGAHCTGLNPVDGLRRAAGFTAETAVVGAVGSTFTIDRGIRRGLLNR